MLMEFKRSLKAFFLRPSFFGVATFLFWAPAPSAAGPLCAFFPLFFLMNPLGPLSSKLLLGNNIISWISWSPGPLLRRIHGFLGPRAPCYDESVDVLVPRPRVTTDRWISWCFLTLGGRDNTTWSNRSYHNISYHIVWYHAISYHVIA